MGGGEADAFVDAAPYRHRRRGGPALCRAGAPAAGRRPAHRQPLQIVLGPSSFAAMGEALRVLPTGASLNLFGAFVIAIGIVYAFGRRPGPASDAHAPPGD